MPNVPESFWADFSKKANPNELIDLVVPIYDRHLSSDDVKGLVAFYQTPPGKNFIAAQPKITQESMTAGQEWGRTIAQRVIDELQKQGKAPAQKK
jgi:hypothetical protein